MSEQKRKLRYRDGRPVFKDEEPTPELLEERRLRRESNPKVQRDRALAEIERHREAMHEAPEKNYQRTLSEWDVRNQDIIRAGLAPHVAVEAKRRALEASAKGQNWDWASGLEKIGDEFRVKAGGKPRQIMERDDAFRDLSSSRYSDKE